MLVQRCNNCIVRSRDYEENVGVAVQFSLKCAGRYDNEQIKYVICKLTLRQILELFRNLSKRE